MTNVHMFSEGMFSQRMFSQSIFGQSREAVVAFPIAPGDLPGKSRGEVFAQSVWGGSPKEHPAAFWGAGRHGGPESLTDFRDRSVQLPCRDFLKEAA